MVRRPRRCGGISVSSGLLLSAVGCVLLSTVASSAFAFSVAADRRTATGTRTVRREAPRRCCSWAAGARGQAPSTQLVNSRRRPSGASSQWGPVAGAAAVALQLAASSPPPSDPPPQNNGDGDGDGDDGYAALTATLSSHHAAIKTSNIEMSIAFYGLLGFEPVAKFRAGPARAAWLEHTACAAAAASGKTGVGFGGRVELIEVPAELLDDEQGGNTRGRKRAVDRMAHPALLGWDHVCLDVTVPLRLMGEVGQAAAKAGNGEDAVEAGNDDGVTTSNIGPRRLSLSDWIATLQLKSQAEFGKTLRIALEPRVRRIGAVNYELAYLYDADGGLVELLNCLGDREDENNEDGDGDGRKRKESSWDDEDDGRIVWRTLET